MGSERDPHEFFPAIEQMAELLPASDQLLVIAKEEVVRGFPCSSKIKFHLVKEEIAPHDEPLHAVRRKRNSSLVVGVHLLATKEIDALVSPGNTGALIAACTMALPLYPGIKRPPLLASIPKKGGQLAIVDVGGLVSCKAEQLLQFAWMGAAYQRAMHANHTPAIGLLNIGTEASKGTTEIRKAYRLLQESCEEHGCRFIGNIEARDVFQSPVDVLVTDGFTGNIFLKGTEGLSAFIFDQIESPIKKEFDHANYPGAILCGVEGLVIKCHGSSTAQGMTRAV